MPDALTPFQQVGAMLLIACLLPLVLVPLFFIRDWMDHRAPRRRLARSRWFV